MLARLVQLTIYELIHSRQLGTSGKLHLNVFSLLRDLKTFSAVASIYVKPK